MKPEKEYYDFIPAEDRMHAVNIFSIKTFYRFFHFSCEECKFASECATIKHKQDGCCVSKYVAGRLQKYVVGKITSFRSSDYYIGEETKECKRKLKRILAKYNVNEH